MKLDYQLNEVNQGLTDVKPGVINVNQLLVEVNQGLHKQKKRMIQATKGLITVNQGLLMNHALFGVDYIFNKVNQGLLKVNLGLIMVQQAVIDVGHVTKDLNCCLVKGHHQPGPD